MHNNDERMSEKTTIPKNLRRQVLFEAGHRCAIPTCKNPDIDIHHIIPWEKCREHRLHNLIALCPNCHRRAHLGEIDRKSLLMYKSKLSTASASSPQLRDEEPWTIGRVIENRQAVLPYSVEIEYPIFSSDNEDLSVLNAVLKGNAYQKLLSERESAYGSYEQDDEWWYGEGNAYASTFRIMLFCEDIISIKISMNSYSAGAVHGYHASEGISFFTKPLRRFDLADLFARPLESINTISDCCIKQLELESHSDESDDWVREGASPKWENFSSFTITERGIEIVFQPYQVSCFADGERIVLLTGRFLKPLLHEDSMFPKIWEER